LNTPFGPFDQNPRNFNETWGKNIVSIVSRHGVSAAARKRSGVAKKRAAKQGNLANLAKLAILK
jgi:hypothetical protein